jgi:hypothetical protein
MERRGLLVLVTTRRALLVGVPLEFQNFVVDLVDAGCHGPVEAPYTIPCDYARSYVGRALSRLVADGAARATKVGLMKLH